MIRKPVQPQDKYVLRLPDGLRDRIKAHAKRYGRSMNTEIVRVLEREYPEPESLKDRLRDLMEFRSMLEQGAADDTLRAIADTIEVMLNDIADGTLPVDDDRIKGEVHEALIQYTERKMEAEQDRYTENMDPEEIEALYRTGTPEKR